MTADIITLSTITKLDLPPERVLQAAIDAKLSGCVIVGFREDGEEYFASSYADAGDCLYHLNRGIYKLCKTADDLTEDKL